MKFIEKRNLPVKIFCYVLPLFSLFIIGCSSTKDPKDELVSIDLKKVLQNEREVPISQFVDSLEYIPLELTPESGINFISKLYLTDEYILVRNTSRQSELLFLFERRSGKFIRQLGRVGNGPDEYFKTLNCFFNPYDNKIYTHEYMRSSVRTYNLNGKFLQSFLTPVANEASYYKNLPIDAFFDSGTFVGYISNSGITGKRLIIFTKDKEIASFLHYEKWSSKNNMVFSQDPIFFTWEKRVSFKEKSNDTIFYISMNKLVPRFVLYSGDARYPYYTSMEEFLRQGPEPKDYYYTLNIFENSNFLFFYLVSKHRQVENQSGTFHLIHNLFIFDKKTQSTSVSKNDDDINFGLTDDINNFLPIAPIAITEKNELVAVLEASKIKKWKTENPDKSAQLILKLPWLSKINELDNPVIVIAKCKK